MSLSATKLPSINGLRAISILLVIVHHLWLEHDIFEGFDNNLWLRPSICFVRDGPLGVNVFFVISGFLITFLLLNEEQKTHTISLKNFYIRRTLRIFPAYYFLLLVYAIFQWLGIIYIENTSWLTAVTYTKYFNWNADWYTAHAWSLSIEEQFYLFWPFVFLLGNKPRKYVALLLVLIAPLMRIYFFKQQLAVFGDLTIFTRIDAIAIGCLFALYQTQIIAFINHRWAATFLVSAILLFSLKTIAFVTKNTFIGFIWIPLGITYGSIANILVAFIMIYSVFGPQKMWFKCMNNNVINYIGKLSYSIYLWQQFFLKKSNYWFNSLPLSLLLMIVVALLSYHFIEKPFLRLKAKF